MHFTIIRKCILYEIEEFRNSAFWQTRILAFSDNNHSILENNIRTKRMSQTKFNKLKKNLLMKHRSEEKNNSEQTEVRISKVFHFRTSDYFNIHKYCDYFCLDNRRILDINISLFQPTGGIHYLIRSFSIGPFRHKQLHHCRLSIRGGYHQGSVSILQDRRRVDS